MSRTRAIQIVGVVGVLLILVGGSAAIAVINHLIFDTGAWSFLLVLSVTLTVHLVVSTWKELGQ